MYKHLTIRTTEASSFSQFVEKHKGNLILEGVVIDMHSHPGQPQTDDKSGDTVIPQEPCITFIAETDDVSMWWNTRNIGAADEMKQTMKDNDVSIYVGAIGVEFIGE